MGFSVYNVLILYIQVCCILFIHYSRLGQSVAQHSRFLEFSIRAYLPITVTKHDPARAENFLPGEPSSFNAISKRKNVVLTTLHRARGRQSKEEKDKDQQYLTLYDKMNESLSSYCFLKKMSKN